MPMRITLTLAAVVLATGASPASALSLTAGTGAALAPFQPGQTATGSGSLTVIDLSPWTLSVADAGVGAGHMVRANSGCTGSDAQLTNPLTVTVTGATSSGSKAISASATTVASGGITLLGGLLLSTAYAQVIPSSQVMLTGCLYSLTATYTLQ